MQPMHDGEVLQLAKQTERADSYMPAATTVHSMIKLTNRISFSQRAHAGTRNIDMFIARA